MVNSPKTEVIEGGAKLARALNDKGVEVTFGKRSEGNDDLSTVIDMAANQINSSSGGNVDIVTEWESTLSDEKVPSEKLTKDTLDTKVDKETGKGLSTNDYTTTEKDKLAGIEAQANKTIVDSSLSSSSENPVQNKVINTALTNKLEETDLTAFCNAVREAYTTYIITLDSATITTKTSPTTITAILTGNGVPVANKTIELYDGSTLVDSEVTDVDGEVNFSVDLTVGTTVYTLKYGSATVDCTVIYDPNTFPLNGTDTIVNKRGINTTGNGILTIGNNGQCYLTDYYLKNNELWTLSYEYYHTNNNWRTWLIVTTDTSRDVTLINYPPTTTYDRWVKVEVKKINSTQVQITVDNGTPTTTTVGSWAGFYFGAFSWQRESVLIRNIKFDPATPR